MASVPTQRLPNGDELPLVGFGTWDLSDDEVREVLPVALDHGYTHVDTAEGYQNEGAVGDVLARYDRETLFVTSKVVPSNLHYEDVLDALFSSLDRLGTDYLDLYLIHWPNPTISLRETFLALERLYEEGRVRNVGVSNFSVYQLKFAQKISRIPIAVNQVEFHPWHYTRDLLNYCHNHGIVVEAAAPLARAAVLDDPVIVDVAEKYDVTPAQVALKWALTKEVVVLPKSTNPDHVRSNLDLFGWNLDPEEVSRIDNIERTKNVYWLELDDEVYGIPA